MVPSAASARAFTELIRGSCSSRTLTARESLSSPRLEATTFSSVPLLKSVSLVCVQKLVLTARAEAAIASVARMARWRIGIPIIEYFRSADCRDLLPIRSRLGGWLIGWLGAFLGQ